MLRQLWQKPCRPWRRHGLHSVIQIRMMSLKSGKTDLLRVSLKLSKGQLYYHVLLSRSFAKPPQQVQSVCECIVILRGFKEVNWKTAKGMMSDTNFLASLQNMDVDGIAQNQVRQKHVLACTSMRKCTKIVPSSWRTVIQLQQQLNKHLFSCCSLPSITTRHYTGNS